MLVSPFPFLAEALAFNVMAFEWSLWEGVRFTLGPEGGTFIMGLKTEVKVKSLSHVQLFRNPWTVPHQDPLTMGILQARILEWVAISFSRGIFLTQGSKPGLLHCRQTLYPLSHQGSHHEISAFMKGVSQVALVIKNPSADAGDGDWVSGSGRSPGGGHGTHSSVLVWRIPQTEEPGRLGRKESEAT